jgi:hypothetical protein
MELDVPMELGGGMYWGIGTASDPLLVPVERSEGLVVSATTDLTLWVSVFAGLWVEFSLDSKVFPRFGMLYDDGVTLVFAVEKMRYAKTGPNRTDLRVEGYEKEEGRIH